MSVGSTIFNGVFGSVDTAYITVRDVRKKAEDLQLGEVSRTSGEMIPAYLLKTEADQLADKIKKTTADQLSGAIAGSGISEVSKDKKFKVQFNPKEFTINANRPIVKKADIEAAKNKGPYTVAPQPPSVSLSMTLIFDEVNLYDSFMSEKFSPGVATLATNIATMGMTIAGSKWTVQPIVEGFIGALRNQYTRTVCFNWGEFAFEGLLNYIAAEYTMFSVSGRPVRAKVRLRISNDITQAALNTWKKDFAEAFKGDETNLVGVDGYTGNILNAGAVGL